MAFVAYLVFFFAMTGHTTALYCLCKQGLSQQVLQKAIDYACGAGADCTPINQNGVCFNPNTVQDHCNYAVNSYFQRKSQTAMSCDFAGAAATSPSPPSNAVGSCVYPSSASPGTPTTTPPTMPTGPGTATPGTGPGTSPGTGSPGTGPGTGSPGTGTGTGSPGTGTGTGAPGTSTVFGGNPTLGPTSTTGMTDSGSVALFNLNHRIFSFALILWVSCQILGLAL